MIVVDTNVVSEWMREDAADAVMRWTNAQSRTMLHTTAVTVAEIRYGLERLPQGRRRVALAATAERVLASFADRVLPFDAEAAEEFGRIMAERQRAGRAMGAFDGQIAAIALSRGATLATRNLRDFEGCGVKFINPWE